MQQVVPSIPEQKVWTTNMNRLNTENNFYPLSLSGTAVSSRAQLAQSLQVVAD